MADTAYPLLRAHRRRRRFARSWTVPRRRIWSIALVVAVVALMGLAVLALRRHNATDPRTSLVEASAAMARGNYSAARNDALAAIAADPASANAHLALARAYLLLGDGLAAEAALTRANDQGIPVSRTRGARARALFLQGDLDRGLAEAVAAPPSDETAIRTHARILAAQGQRQAAEHLLAPLLAPVLARHKNVAPALVDLARLRIEAGDIAGAAVAATRAAALAPRDPSALAVQGEIVRTRYGLVAAMPWFEAALRRDAYYYPALIEYAATLGDLGQYADMLAATRKALAARPGSPQALYLQATLAVRAGRITLARSLLQRAGPIGDRVPGPMLLAGALDYVDSRSEQAIGTWRQLVERQPLNLPARRLLAAALLRSGDARGALAMLGPLIARGDADTYSLTLAARASERLGDRAAAGRQLDRAATGSSRPSGTFAIDGPLASIAQDAARAPGDPSLAVALIRGRIDSGDIDIGIDLARTLAAQSPGDPALQRALGDAFNAGGRVGEAVGAYTRAADLAFDEPTMLRLVDALGRAGHARQAAISLALYLQQNPQSIVAQRLRAHWQVASGAGAKAIEPLEALRHMTGNRNATLLTDLALAYVAAGDGAVARRYARAAYALSPLDPAVVDAYGLALAADQEVTGARQLFAKALSLDPGNATIRAHAQQAAR